MGNQRNDSAVVSEVPDEAVDSNEMVAAGAPVAAGEMVSTDAPAGAVEQAKPIEQAQTGADVETQPEVTRLWVLSAQEYVGEAVIQSRYQYDGGGALTGRHVVCVGNSVIAGRENDESFTTKISNRIWRPILMWKWNILRGKYLFTLKA